MKHALINKVQKWSWSLLSCLLLVSERCSAQFVEVSFQIEGTSWPRNPSGQRTEHQRTYHARCIFGTNIWMIEGEFTRTAKESWWCIGTNIIKHTVIIKELLESEKRPSVLFADE